MTIRIIPNEIASLPGKLADAELYFGVGDSPDLDGLKLIGFAIWEPRIVGGKRRVTFPDRHYRGVHGERCTLTLLRSIVDVTAQNALRDRILTAFAEYQQTGVSR